MNSGSEFDRDDQQLLRELTPRVLGVLVRRYRDFADCEDAVQEAMLAASLQWPREGKPDNPLAWLVRVATRRLTDQIRANAARRYREQIVASQVSLEDQIALAADAAMTSERDETLELYFMCCHPSLTTSSQIALTLRAVGGLTTAEIARAFLVPEATMAQRLARAKGAIKQSGVGFARSSTGEPFARLGAVLHVLYLIFNEGYAASSGPSVYRVDLSGEAIRVTRLLQSVLPESPEVNGLLSLMVLTDARRDARVGSSGELIPLHLQDRSLWRVAAISEGTQLLQRALSQGAVGPYQVQAAIAALHSEASSAESADWPQILALYGLLLRMDSSPMVRLSHTIALAMVKGPDAGLAVLDELEAEGTLPGSYRTEATRAHLLERAGLRDQAIVHFRRAADATPSVAERNFLLLQASRLTEKA